MFKNKLLAISASVGIILGSILVIMSANPQDVANQFSVGSYELGMTLDSDGNFTPNVDAACNLGSSTYEWNDVFIDGTATIDVLVVDETLDVTGDLNVTADLRTSTFLGVNSYDTIAFNTAPLAPIVPTSSFINLISTGLVSASSSTIAIDTSVNTAGDFLVITTTGTNSIVFLDDPLTAKLKLGGARTVGTDDVLTLMLVSTGSLSTAKYWLEVSFVQN